MIKSLYFIVRFFFKSGQWGEKNGQGLTAQLGADR